MGLSFPFLFEWHSYLSILFGTISVGLFNLLDCCFPLLHYHSTHLLFCFPLFPFHLQFFLLIQDKRATAFSLQSFFFFLQWLLSLFISAVLLFFYYFYYFCLLPPEWVTHCFLFILLLHNPDPPAFCSSLLDWAGFATSGFFIISTIVCWVWPHSCCFLFFSFSNSSLLDSFFFTSTVSLLGGVCLFFLI